VRSFADFSQIPAAVPRVGGGDSSDLDTSGFKFAPGGPTTINIVRAYYRWEVITDLVRPYVTNLRPAGTSMPNDYLMVSTAAFRNEAY
ncbi:MAG: pilus assembly protein, partial [Rhizobium giardinii]